ncbi:MAG: DUF11 domain-containing protein [Chitinophagaceae bacterium]|nr:DUF11 domain-containing protein [Chitinophagaceae bacterium]
MRNLTLTFCSLLLFIQVTTAQTQSVVWKKCFGGSAKDVANDVLINNDGTIVVAGYSYSNDGNVTGHHGTTTTSDGWVIKLDANGNLLWQKSLGGSADDLFYTVIATDDGGYLCVGNTNSNDGDVTGNHGGTDVWAVKVDGNGTIVWSKCYGGTQTDIGKDATILYDGQLALIGSSNSADGNVLSGPSNNTASDAWVIKLNKTDGNLLWEKVINYGDSTLSDGGLNIVESNNSTIMAYISGAAVYTYWSNDTWNSRVQNAGFVYELNEGNGAAALFTSVGPGWQREMVMNKTNTGYNFAYKSVGYWTSPISCYAYGRGVVKKDFAGNTISSITLGSYPCDDSHDAIVDYVSQPNGFIVSSAGKPITVGQKEVEEPDFWGTLRVVNHGYISNIGPIGVSNGVDTFTAIKELSIGDEFITVGKTNTGKLNDTSAAATDFQGNFDFWVLKFQSLNTIKANFFIDYNNNNIKDAGELPFNSALSKTVNQYGASSSWAYPVNGVAETTVDTGTFKTTASLFRPYYTVSPTITTNTFTTFKNTVTINYPVHPIPGSRDYSVYISTPFAIRPGFDAYYGLTYSNAAIDTLIDKQVMFVKDSRLQFVSSSPLSPVSIVGDTITWNIARLVPDSSGHISIHLQAPGLPAIQLGDTVRVSAYIDSTGDLVQQNNVSSSIQIVTGSYDPNDKQENYGGTMQLSEAAAGKYLTYTIRFQNTGNDTAFNITVRDTLSALLDSTSFEMINTSHNYSVSIKNGRYIAWKFNNIKLVDSFHNEPLSHGYITYRIKPKLPVGIGDVIQNSAAIYFDYNPPVITNTSTTAIKGTPSSTSWTGAVSTAWENPLNWSNGMVPDVNTIVTIPAGVPNYPEVSSNATCYRISVMPTATVLVKTGFKLKVNAKN